MMEQALDRLPMTDFSQCFSQPCLGFSQSPSKSSSLRKPNSSFSYTSSYLQTHLCNSTRPSSSPQSTSCISANPSESLINHSSLANLTRPPNGHSFFHRLERNFGSFSSQIGFRTVFSCGYWLNSANLRIFERNGGGFLSVQGSVGRLRSFSSESDRESVEYDVVIVGAGPAGLSAAILLKQMCSEKGVDFSLRVVEKGPEVAILHLTLIGFEWAIFV